MWDHVDDVECSDAGICDRDTGACTCFDGYDGSACQRSACPNDCSGHGQCRSNEVGVKIPSATFCNYFCGVAVEFAVTFFLS